MRTYIAPIQSDTSIVQRCRVALYEGVVALLAALAAALSAVPPDLRDHPLIREAIAEGEAALARELRIWVKLLRRMLVAGALARFEPTHRKIKHARHPQHLARGLRRRRLNHVVRRISNGIVAGMHHGSLEDRALRLKRALDRFDRLVTRALARFHRIWRCPARAALVLATPQHDPIFTADAPTPACADSS